MFGDIGQLAKGDRRGGIEPFGMPLALLPQLIEARQVTGEELKGDDTEGVDIPLLSLPAREITRGELFGAGIKEQIPGLEALKTAHENLPKISDTEFLPAFRIPREKNARRPQTTVEKPCLMNLSKPQGEFPHDLEGLRAREQGHEPLQRADLPLIALTPFPSVKRKDTGGEGVGPLQDIIVDRRDPGERRGAVAESLEIRLQKAIAGRLSLKNLDDTALPALAGSDEGPPEGIFPEEIFILVACYFRKPLLNELYTGIAPLFLNESDVNHKRTTG